MIKLSIVIILFLFSNCLYKSKENNQINKKARIISSESDSTDFYYLFDSFNFDSSVNAYLEKKIYKLTDSIDKALKDYYSKRKIQIISDTNFQKAVLFFFEKNYIERSEGKNKVEKRRLANFTLSIHNSSKFIGFLVCYANGINFNFDYEYEYYCNISKDISCLIDFENKYKHLTLTNPKHIAIHLKCIKSLPDYCVDE
jgi:hypothetical protein